MVSIKGGTRTWSEAAQQSSLKPDSKQTLSADEKQNLMGDKDFGEYLNKIADPNWVDPAKARRVGNPDLDKDAFMKLFLAQLKNQDPMNPLKSHEMAAQLAQFTSLEKLSNIDEGITGMTKAQESPQSFEALNLIGKVVSGDSAKLLRSDEDQQHDIEFDLNGDVQKAVLSIKDASGQEIKKLEVTGLKKGKNSVYWNGRLDNGTQAQPGDYKVVIEARNTAGDKIHAKTAFEGKVTGVNFTSKGPILAVGKQKIRLSEVKGISVPTEDVPVKTAHQVKSVKELKTDRSDAGQAAAAGMGGSLEGVGMSQSLINKVQGETK